MSFWTWLLQRLDRLLEDIQGRLRRLEPSSVGTETLVALIRREGVISEGRYVMYFEVTLFGDNPVVLEEFGRVLNRDNDPPPRFKPELMEAIQPYRYYIELRQRFNSVEEAREFWAQRGASALWAD